MRQFTRVTIALPRDLWDSIKNTVPAGKRSGLVAQALENELRRRKRLEQFENLRHLIHNSTLSYNLRGIGAGS